MKTFRLPLVLLIAVVMLSIDTCTIAAEEPEADSDAAVALDYRKNPGARIQAIQRMAVQQDGNAAGPLISILLDKAEEQGVRASAARALGEFREAGPEVLKALIEVFREPGAEANLRYTILLSIGKLKNESGISLLKEALAESDPMIRFKAVQSMGDLGSAEAVSIITGHLNSETDKMVRAQAARVLGNYDQDASQLCLAGLLKGDPEAVVRLNAALSLKRLASLNAAAKAALEAAGEDSSSMVREAAKGGNP
jgi:HEAT repeat protein